MQTQVLTDGVLVVCEEPLRGKTTIPYYGDGCYNGPKRIPYPPPPLFAGKSDCHKHKKNFINKNRNVVTE
jgi:hypothetical protein